MRIPFSPFKVSVAITVTAAAALCGAGAASAALTAAPPAWQRTCTAFTAYQQHPSAARLTTVVIDSTRLGRSYLRADVGQLYADASSPAKNAWQALSVSVQYVAQDCYGGD